MINIDEVREYAEKHTLTEAKEHFSYSKGYLSAVARKNSFHFAKENRDMKMKSFILENYKKMTIAELAVSLESKYEKTAYLCRVLGVKPVKDRKIRGRKADVKRIVDCLVDGGFTYASIAEAFGVSRQRIAQIYSGN